MSKFAAADKGAILALPSNKISLRYNNKISLL